MEGGSLGRQFAGTGLVNLTVIAVVAINGRNRLAISFRVVDQTDHANGRDVAKPVLDMIRLGGQLCWITGFGACRLLR
jgi:hypothetical protein